MTISDSDDARAEPAPLESDHWQWRLRMAEALAARCDMEALGVLAIYVIGSTKDATAGPASDIDLLVHHDGSPQGRALIESYVRGWSQSLSQWNEARTGERTDGLIDLHLITDADIAARGSYACMIGSVTNSARLLRRRE